MSNFAWYDKAPSHWIIKRLKFATRFLYGDALPSIRSEEGTIPVYGSNGIFSTHTESNTLAPAIIVGRKGSHGKLNWTDVACFASDTTFFIDERATKENLRWLFYALQSLNLDEISDDTGVPGLNRDKAYASCIAVPPLHEQQEIADYLDREIARLDDLRKEKERFLDLLERKRAALIAHAVTGRLTLSKAIWRSSGINELGDVPEHWHIKKIAWLFDLIASGTTPKSDRPEFYEGGVMPWITTGELRDAFVNTTQKSVTSLAMEQFVALTVFPRGALLMALYGATIGRLGILNLEAVSNQACCGMAHPKGVEIRFMFYWLLSQRDNIIILASGGGQPNISQEIVRQLRVAVPPLDEQRAIVSHLERVLKEMDELKTALLDSLKLLNKQRAALIAHAVSGHLKLIG